MADFASIEQALDALRAGKNILVIDDPDRENEGDIICAAQFATTENVNFMATHAKGLICMPMSGDYCDKLGLPQMVEKGLRPDVVVLDPPRKGCEEKVLSTIAKVGPRRVVYVSCDVATQARDAKFLCQHGYQAEKCQSVDMFCHTGHVETVVLMSRKEK